MCCGLFTLQDGGMTLCDDCEDANPKQQKRGFRGAENHSSPTKIATLAEYSPLTVSPWRRMSFRGVWQSGSLSRLGGLDQ